MPHLLGLNIPNFLPDWGFFQPAGRLIWSSVIFGIMTLIAIILIRRPKSPEPATWAGTIVGAMAVWIWMTLAYAVIPHEWLTFAAKYLNFGKDTFALYKNGLIPFDVTRLAVAEALVGGIYVFMLVLNVVLFVLWQKRPIREEATEVETGEAETTTTGGFSRFRRSKGGTSAYGRPVTTAE